MSVDIKARSIKFCLSPRDIKDSTMASEIIGELETTDMLLLISSMIAI